VEPRWSHALRARSHKEKKEQERRPKTKTRSRNDGAFASPHAILVSASRVSSLRARIPRGGPRDRSEEGKARPSNAQKKKCMPTRNTGRHPPHLPRAGEPVPFPGHLAECARPVCGGGLLCVRLLFHACEGSASQTLRSKNNAPLHAHGLVLVHLPHPPNLIPRLSSYEVVRPKPARRLVEEAGLAATASLALVSFACVPLPPPLPARPAPERVRPSPSPSS